MNAKLTAAASILLAFCMVLPAVSAEGPEPEETYDTGFAWSVFLLGAVIGIGLKIIFEEMTADPAGGADAEQCRTFEADYIAGIVNTNLSTAAGYSDTIADLIPFSREHFIRQGELASAYLWSPESEYNAPEILTQSSARSNLANLQTNIFTGFSAVLKMIEDRMSAWDSGIYKGNMNVSFVYGNNNILSDDLRGFYLPVSKTCAGSNTAYLCSPEIWTNDSASIVRSDGHVVQLHKGYNNLGSGFRADVYTLKNDRVYASYMLPSLTSASAPIYAGMVMSAGETSEIAYLDSNGTDCVVNNAAYDRINIKVETKEGYSSLINASKPLAVLDACYKEMCRIQTAVSSSAAALWDIYNTAGDSNVYLSTLSVPDFCGDVELSKTEKEIIALLALEQLASYYQDHEDLKTSGYLLSKESLRLYCEGSIRDSQGNIIAEDAVFTPYFYEKNTVLFSHQSNKSSQNGTAAVWAQNTSLASWDMNVREAALLNISEGCTLEIRSMVYQGREVNSVSLRVSEIDITVLPDYSDDVTDPKLPDNGKSASGPVRVICAAAGIILAAAGIYYRRFSAAAAGIIILLFGAFAVPLLEEYL